MLGDRQQLHVREAEIARVSAELTRELRIREELTARAAPPGSQVHLVDRDRLAQPIARPASAQPLPVIPAEARIGCRHRRSRWAVLERGAVRIGLELQLSAIAREDLVLVQLAGAELRQEQLPDSGVAAHRHRMIAAVPMIEGADDADALRVRRPHGEADAGHAVDRQRVRAEKPVGVHVTAGSEAREVARVDVQRERIRVVALVPNAVVRLEAHAVGQLQQALCPRPFEQWSAGNTIELDRGLHESHATCARQQHANPNVLGAA
jgi:hypothetical protein